MAQLAKKLPVMQETWVQSLGWEDPLEEGKATHSSVLAWRIRGLYSPWGHKESDMTEQLNFGSVILEIVYMFHWRIRSFQASGRERQRFKLKVN